MFDNIYEQMQVRKYQSKFYIDITLEDTMLITVQSFKV